MTEQESQPIIELQDVHVRFPTRSSGFFHKTYVDALAGVSLTVKRGQTLGIVGESGSGKSTAAKVLVGLEQPTSGQVVFAGEPVRTFTTSIRKRLGRILSVVFQDPATALNARMTIRDALLDPMQVHHIGSAKERDRRVRELIGLVGLPTSALDAMPGQLSGGQRQRVAIARALALDPQVIVADEPTSALDVSVRAQILNLLTDLKNDLGPRDGLHLARHPDGALPLRRDRRHEQGTRRRVRPRSPGVRLSHRRLHALSPRGGAIAARAPHPRLTTTTLGIELNMSLSASASSAVRFAGVVPPVATPLNLDRSVDHASLERLVDYLVDAGVSGLFALGSTGETAYFTDAQRVEIARTIVSAAAGRVPVIAGAIELTSARIVETARQLTAAGADAIVTTAPLYTLNSQIETAAHFRAIAAGIDVPLWAYDVPVRVHSKLGLDLLMDLARRGRHPRSEGLVGRRRRVPPPHRRQPRRRPAAAAADRTRGRRGRHGARGRRRGGSRTCERRCRRVRATVGCRVPR